MIENWHPQSLPCVNEKAIPSEADVTLSEKGVFLLFLFQWTIENPSGTEFKSDRFNCSILLLFYHFQ